MRSTHVSRRARSAAISAVVLAAGLLGSSPGVASDAQIWGTEPGRVMVQVRFAAGDQPDQEIWHAALQTVDTTDGGDLRIRIESSGAPALILPLDPGDDPVEWSEMVKGAEGQLLRVEYDPAEDAPAGRIDMDWSLTGEPPHSRSGDVPMPSVVRRAILGFYGDRPPASGIFRGVAHARATLDELWEHAAYGGGMRSEELAESALTAVKASGVELSFYRDPQGRPITESDVEAVVCQGLAQSARVFWEDAVQRIETQQFVNQVLDEITRIWDRCGDDLELIVPLEGEDRQLTRRGVRELRRAAAQRFLDRAAASAVDRREADTKVFLRMFRRELELANAQKQRFQLNDFTIGKKPASEEAIEDLLERARGESGIWGWFKKLIT
jgi:hypothetical protein